MRLRIVRIRKRISEEFPVFWVLSDVMSKRRQDRPVEALHLPICLGVTGRRKDVLDAKNAANLLEELGHELFSAIR